MIGGLRNDHPSQFNNFHSLLLLPSSPLIEQEQVQVVEEEDMVDIGNDSDDFSSIQSLSTHSNIIITTNNDNHIENTYSNTNNLINAKNAWAMEPPLVNQSSIMMALQSQSQSQSSKSTSICTSNGGVSDPCTTITDPQHTSSTFGQASLLSPHSSSSQSTTIQSRPPPTTILDQAVRNYAHNAISNAEGVNDKSTAAADTIIAPPKPVSNSAVVSKNNIILGSARALSFRNRSSRPSSASPMGERQVLLFTESHPNDPLNPVFRSDKLLLRSPKRFAHPLANENGILFESPLVLVAIKLKKRRPSATVASTNKFANAFNNVFKKSSERKSAAAAAAASSTESAVAQLPTICDDKTLQSTTQKDVRKIGTSYDALDKELSMQPADKQVHFTLMTPGKQIAMIASNAIEFRIFRETLEEHRARVLANPDNSSSSHHSKQRDKEFGGPHSSRTDDATSSKVPGLIPTHADKDGRQVLRELRDRHLSNTICAGCSAPNPDWIAVERSLQVPIIICEDCSGVYRSQSNFYVRSFLYDLTLFKDEDSQVGRMIRSLINETSSRLLTQASFENRIPNPPKLFKFPPSNIASNQNESVLSITSTSISSNLLSPTPLTANPPALAATSVLESSPSGLRIYQPEPVTLNHRRAKSTGTLHITVPEVQPPKVPSRTPPPSTAPAYSTSSPNLLLTSEDMPELPKSIIPMSGQPASRRTRAYRRRGSQPSIKSGLKSTSPSPFASPSQPGTPTAPEDYDLFVDEWVPPVPELPKQPTKRNAPTNSATIQDPSSPPVFAQPSQATADTSSIDEQKRANLMMYDQFIARQTFAQHENQTPRYVFPDVNGRAFVKNSASMQRSFGQQIEDNGNSQSYSLRKSVDENGTARNAFWASSSTATQDSSPQTQGSTANNTYTSTSKTILRRLMSKSDKNLNGSSTNVDSIASQTDGRELMDKWFNK